MVTGNIYSWALVACLTRDWNCRVVQSPGKVRPVGRLRRRPAEVGAGDRDAQEEGLLVMGLDRFLF